MVVTASVASLATGLIGSSTLCIVAASTHMPPLLPNPEVSYANEAITPAYAFYFDHKRRSQPEFRRNLRREQRKTARMAEVYAAAEEGKHLEQIKKLVQDAIAAGFPTTTEEKEQYFLEQVSLGEQLSQDRKRARRGRHVRAVVLTIATAKRVVDSALAFYKGLKVYPNPSDLVAIYDKTVSKVGRIAACLWIRSLTLTARA